MGVGRRQDVTFPSRHEAAAAPPGTVRRMADEDILELEVEPTDDDRFDWWTWLAIKIGIVGAAMISAGALALAR